MHCDFQIPAGGGGKSTFVFNRTPDNSHPLAERKDIEIISRNDVAAKMTIWEHFSSNTQWRWKWTGEVEELEFTEQGHIEALLRKGKGTNLASGVLYYVTIGGFF